MTTTSPIRTALHMCAELFRGALHGDLPTLSATIRELLRRGRGDVVSSAAARKARQRRARRVLLAVVAGGLLLIAGAGLSTTLLPHGPVTVVVQEP